MAQYVPTSSNSGNVWKVETLKCSPKNSLPEYKCWRPKSSRHFFREYLPSERLTHISRVLHFEDYKKVFRQSSIVPHEITVNTHTSLPRGYRGSWFGVPGDETGHNWYGNVNCLINFQMFLSDFDLKYYFIEIVEFKTLCAPRFLLTTQEVPPEMNVTEYDPMKSDGPWYQDGTGQNFYINEGPNKNGVDCPYELEFLLALSDEEYKMLYDMCEVKAVNHSNANDEGYRKCKKYRSGKHWTDCPSAWSIQSCQLNLDKLKDDLDCSLNELFLQT